MRKKHRLSTLFIVLGLFAAFLGFTEMYELYGLFEAGMASTFGLGLAGAGLYDRIKIGVSGKYGCW